MNELKSDMTRIQELICEAYTATGGLVALAEGGMMTREKRQQTLERTMEKFEQSVIEMRRLCERNSPGVGGYGGKPPIPAREVTGEVSVLEYSWLHIKLNALLPHCRFQTPGWLTDTIRLLLDAYEAEGRSIPFYKHGAVLFIDEHSDITGRNIYDQDNKGWKAVSNALKGRVFPDDDQYSLGVVLLSAHSHENVTHVTVTDTIDVGSFMDMRYGFASVSDIYSGA